MLYKFIVLFLSVPHTSQCSLEKDVNPSANDIDKASQEFTNLEFNH